MKIERKWVKIIKITKVINYRYDQGRIFFFLGGGGWGVGEGGGGWGERRRNFRQNILLSLGIAARVCFWYVANLGELIDFYPPGIIRKHGFVMIWGGIEVN